MLEITDLHVEVGEKEILHDINLRIGDGETHVLMGPNGSGKSTLLMTIMGFSGYKVTQGKILYNGKEITRLPVNERAKAGIGLMFQRPPTVGGLKLGKLLSATSGESQEAILDYAKTVHMLTFLGRDVNKGFSGGEIKRSEILQLMVQHPDFVMLDEPESGVDLENISLIGAAIGKLLEKDLHIIHRKKSGLIITHTGFILDYLDANVGHMMCDGAIKCRGNPREMLKEIKARGYRECMECQKV
ncbi:MAG: ABC transporter ATP-binding protein [Methanomicrobiales archaeon]|nr:ABC transporter ATP-binding protein [Methanomicrobiales archaeon]